MNIYTEHRDWYSLKKEASLRWMVWYKPREPSDWDIEEYAAVPSANVSSMKEYLTDLGIVEEDITIKLWGIYINRDIYINLPSLDTRRLKYDNCYTFCINFKSEEDEAVFILRSSL